MCGIGGIITRKADARLPETGAAMLRRLAHRGPDDDGYLAYSRAGLRAGHGRPDAAATAEVLLLHRRLSIIDLTETGSQPMSSPDGRYHITFNGEIYNYIELREELVAAGFTFRGSSDTEVLLAALAHWGVEALPRLIGMFAFALLDVQQRTVLLARDGFGIKPLYYSEMPGQIAFASEMKALLEAPGLSRRVRPESLCYYLATGDTDYGGQTMFAGIARLPAAHYLVIHLDGADGPTCSPPQQYWRIDAQRTLDISFEEAARTMRDLFMDSIRLHMRSDVPVGTALSGGIDSSAIALVLRAIGGKHLDFHSFSFIAKDPAVCEERWVDLAAAASGATVHKIHIQPEELAADLDDLIWTQDEPFGSTSIYAQYRVFRASQEAGVKVLIDGQGADELLAGYQGSLMARLRSLLGQRQYGSASRYMYQLMRRRRVSPHTLLRTLTTDALGQWLEPMAQRGWRKRVAQSGVDMQWLDRQGVAVDEMRPQVAWPTLKAALRDALEQSPLPALLRYEDRNSMAFGVESRVPFLTPQLAQFTASLPEEYIIDATTTRKSIFRAAMRGIVPDQILDRQDKIGFATPEASWFKVMKPWVKKIVGSGMATEIPAINQAGVIRQTQAILDGSQRFDWRVWRWINLIRWSEKMGVEY